MSACGFCLQPVPDVPTVGHTCKDVPGEVFMTSCHVCGWVGELLDGMPAHRCTPLGRAA